MFFLAWGLGFLLGSWLLFTEQLDDVGFKLISFLYLLSLPSFGVDQIDDGKMLES